MRLPFRRKPPLPVPAIGSAFEAHIPLSALSGVAAGNIRGHVLLIATRDNHLSISGSCCDHLAAVIVTEAAVVFARRAAEASGHESEPS